MTKNNIFISSSYSEYQRHLIDKALCNIQDNNHPAIIVDYTGELAQKYYNQERGDIIFSPNDNRSSDWDFLADCSDVDKIGEFFDKLIQYSTRDNRLELELKDINHMKIIFIDSICFLKKANNFSFQSLKQMIFKGSIEEISKNLAGTKSIEILNKTKIDLIPALARLALCIEKLDYLDTKKQNNLFSIKSYFNLLKKGSNALLFLGSDHYINNLKIIIDLCLTDLVLYSQELKKDVYFVFDKMQVLSRFSPIINALGVKHQFYYAISFCI